MSFIQTTLKSFVTKLLRQTKSATPILCVLALVFLLVAIWWLGPQWSWREHKPLASLTMRVLATVVLLVVPLLLWALSLQRRNRAMAEQQQHQAEVINDPALLNEAAQERALDQSLTVLKEHLPGRQNIYKLPWYLVMGASGAGKTSFVNRSSQNFYLTGVTKTQSERVTDPDLAFTIDWWMGQQAVLIDAPGELISQKYPKEERATATNGEAESSDATSDAKTPTPEPSTVTTARKDRRPPTVPESTLPRLWMHLVGWLARNRSRRPLNGVVMVVDVIELLNQAPSDRKVHASVLRSRLSELGKQLGTRPPIYVVLSKLDRLVGFNALFSRLPREIREDIFGFTFTLDSVKRYDAWQSELTTAYRDMVARLHEHVFDALSESATPEQRQGLFSLAREMDGLLPLLSRFLGEVLGSDRLGTPALPRGVYFSSVYQQGLLHNAFVNAAAESYGMPIPTQPNLPAGRGAVYFAQQVFQRVIYPEAGLAGDNLKVLADKRRALLLNLGVASLGGALVVAGWHHYYGLNREMAQSVLAKSQQFRVKDIDSGIDPTGRNLLAPLDQIRDAVTVYGDYRKAWPLVANMGLYQGGKIGPKVDEAYLQLLSKRFLPALADGVMSDIEAATENPDAQLEALRVYRMIEDRPNRRPAIVQAWMARAWQQAFPNEGSIQNALMRHLDYALTYADAVLPQYQSRVSDLQQKLREIPMPQRVYMTMQRQSDDTLPAALDLRREIGPAFDIVYRADADAAKHADALQVQALLTARGFKDYFVPRGKDLTELAMIDEWTLGQRNRIDYSEADKQVLAGRIRTIYGADYMANWRRAINQLDVVDFANLGQGVAVLESITSPAAPLRRLVETVRDNTVLYTPKPEDAKLAAPVMDAAQQQLAGDISRSFAALADLLTAKGDKPPYLDETTQAIANVRDLLKGVQDSPDRGKAALATVLDRFSLKGQDPIGNLQRMAAGLPEPLNQQVRKLADESSQVLMIEALRNLEQRWDAEVCSFYRERLANRYPFNPAATADASLDDFEAFFGPNGRLQQFRDKYLKVFLEDNLDALYSDRRGGYLVRTDVLTQLEAANRIRDAFFTNRGALGLQFTATPLGLTPNRRSSVLGIEGQLIPYSHGPSSSVGLIWPNSLGDSSDSRITLVNGGGNSSSLVFRGPWSMFRLLSRAQLTGATATTVDLSFTADDGGAMRYRLTAEKANNPFTQRIFSGFTLPRTLLRDETAGLPSPPAASVNKAP